MIFRAKISVKGSKNYASQNMLFNYKVIDLTGIIRIEKEGIFGDLTIETNELSNGLYMLQINVGEKTLIEKIIIQHR